jgi:RasGEF domain
LHTSFLFQELEKLFAPGMSHRNYRMRFEAAAAKKHGAIPALSVHLSDLVMIGENVSEDRGSLNFSKLVLLARVISSVLAQQASLGPLSIEPAEPAASQLSKRNLEFESFNEKNLFNLSLECEPRE